MPTDRAGIAVLPGTAAEHIRCEYNNALRREHDYSISGVFAPDQHLGHRNWGNAEFRNQFPSKISPERPDARYDIQHALEYANGQRERFVESARKRWH